MAKAHCWMVSIGLYENKNEPSVSLQLVELNYQQKKMQAYDCAMDDWDLQRYYTGTDFSDSLDTATPII